MERWIDQQRIDLFRALCVLHVRKNMRVNIECESHIFGETPAISEIVAAVWRKSYSRTGGNSADLSNIDLFVYTN